MTRPRILPARLLGAALAVGVAIAATVTVCAITIPKVQFTETKLPNGLRVIVSPDHAAPVVSLVVAYDVGFAQREAGQDGFAHLFEHLMYKGSQNVADGELAALIQNYGGDHNGQTDKDHTIYFEEVPQPAGHGAVPRGGPHEGAALTQENLANQLEAVKEERRFRVDNQPYGKTNEQLDELAFRISRTSIR
jgi:hypothetical protein